MLNVIISTLFINVELIQLYSIAIDLMAFYNYKTTLDYHIYHIMKIFLCLKSFRPSSFIYF